MHAGVEVNEPIAIFDSLGLQSVEARGKLCSRRVNLLGHVVREEAELASQFVSRASLNVLQR